MKFTFLLLAVCMLTVTNAYCQDTSATLSDTTQLVMKTPRTNPIIYAGIGFGGGITGMTGLMGSFDLNYQFKENLITARLVSISNFSIDLYGAPVIIIPIVQENGSLDETALLYWRRYVKNGHAVDISAGISTTNRVIKYNDIEGNRQRIQEQYIGLPFEVAVRWF